MRSASGRRGRALADPGIHRSARLSRSAFAITETELNVIAALAIIGLSSTPRKGYSTPAASGFSLDGKGWIGGDRSRVWLRAEGDSAGGRLEEARAHVLYGRQFSRWWDIVGGVRQDVRPGSAQTWAAIGIQGLAPYWFEIEATAYVGASGRTQARFEVEYELFLTNRLILQPVVEAEIVGKSDPERGVGAGVSTTDAGFRLRYAFRPEVAPYVGVAWSNKWGKTAAFANDAGEATGGARLVTGVRLWF